MKLHRKPETGFRVTMMVECRMVGGTNRILIIADYACMGASPNIEAFDLLGRCFPRDWHSDFSLERATCGS